MYLYCILLWLLNRKCQPLPLHYGDLYPWSCVWDCHTDILCRLLYISPGEAAFLFPLPPSSPWCVKISGYSRPSVNNGSVTNQIIIMQSCLKHWTLEMPTRYILSSVLLGLNLLPPLPCIQHIWLRFWWWWENMYFASPFYYHHQIGNMLH